MYAMMIVAQFCPQDLDVFFHTTKPAKDVVDRRRKRILTTSILERDIPVSNRPEREGDDVSVAAQRAICTG
jgi:hypothetical protein